MGKNIIELPKADMVTFTFESGSEITFRLSGTESKVRLYLSAIGSSEVQANFEMEKCKQWAHALMRFHRLLI